MAKNSKLYKVRFYKNARNTLPMTIDYIYQIIKKRAILTANNWDLKKSFHKISDWFFSLFFGIFIFFLI